jgi:hypothetical protein
MMNVLNMPRTLFRNVEETVLSASSIQRVQKSRRATVCPAPACRCTSHVAFQTLWGISPRVLPFNLLHMTATPLGGKSLSAVIVELS